MSVCFNSRSQFFSSLLLVVLPLSSFGEGRNASLEEVIVTAQKREQSLQATPVAVSVMTQAQLSQQGIASLDALGQGAIPSLRVQPWGNTPTTLVVAIRGNGPIDIASATRDGAVAIYSDGFYLARPQSLTLDVPDLERIEVLRGPQGTLFGRNATGGAVNLITKKPSGEFHIQQTLGVGNYDQRRDITRLDLPRYAGIAAKIDYMHSERDGWVRNTAPHSNNYDGFKKDGGRLALNFQPSESVDINYVYDLSHEAATMKYFQFYEDFQGQFGAERDRLSRTRLPVYTLDPTKTNQQGHALTATWDAVDSLTIKSLTGCRDLDETTGGNYNGSLYFNGAIIQLKTKQHQCSQEFQFIGRADRVEWVGGLYYFGERAHQETTDFFSLDQFGSLTGSVLQPITPPTRINPYTGMPIPVNLVSANADSYAGYAQGTWVPPMMSDRLHLTAGLRYSEDRKSGQRFQVQSQKFDLHSDHVDETVGAAYDWSHAISSYLKWSSGYRAGGANPSSVTFSPYGEEKVQTWELGLKSEFLDRRARFNADIFTTRYKNMQIDVENPTLITLTETINAKRDVRVDGLEIDAALVPLEGLEVGLNYTYLAGHMPLQPNSLPGGGIEQFELTQTPRHAGAATLDYTFTPMALGTLSAHADATSTDRYAYIPQGAARQDAYTLINARLSLADIPVSQGAGKFKISIWGKNITDEQYVALAFPVPGAAVIQAFGDPRTFGLDVSYNY